VPNNFHYAAYSYLDEWVNKDRRFHSILAEENSTATSAGDQIECLSEVAAYYGVARTLKTIEEKPRLKTAFDALQSIKRPNENTVVATVEEFARILGGTYGGTPISAASKFLWMRFRNPVVIRDSVVSSFLCEFGYSDSGYSDYYRIWTDLYRLHEVQIVEACSGLTKVKVFTRACDIADMEIKAWTTSEWFKQRVFDHFMLNEPSFRNS